MTMTDEVKQAEFKVGDVVWLKSGGPAMTVTAIGELTLRCDVKWFTFEEMEGKSSYPAVCLTHEDPDPMSIDEEPEQENDNG